jgi:hypothetical protein
MQLTADARIFAEENYILLPVAINDESEAQATLMRGNI